MREFIKRHKLLSTLFLVSVLLMIKNSSIPYPFNPPLIIQYVFNAPTSDFFSNVAGMVDIFTSAYVTSLLFYIIVDYIPAIKQEKNATEIITSKLVDIYLYMSEIIAMIEYSAKRQGIEFADNYSKLDGLQFKDIPIFCKEKTYKNGLENGISPYSYNLPKDCLKFNSLILNSCRDISDVASFSYCDPSIIHIISRIQLSDLLRIIGTLNECETQSDQQVFHPELGKGYKDFLEAHSSLESKIDTKFSYTMVDMSDDETRKWIMDSAKFFSENPDAAKFLAAMKGDK